MSQIPSGLKFPLCTLSGARLLESGLFPEAQSPSAFLWGKFYLPSFSQQPGAAGLSCSPLHREEARNQATAPPTPSLLDYLTPCSQSSAIPLAQRNPSPLNMARVALSSSCPSLVRPQMTCSWRRDKKREERSVKVTYSVPTIRKQLPAGDLPLKAPKGFVLGPTQYS